MTHDHDEPAVQCGSTNRAEDENGLFAIFAGGCGKVVPLSFVYRCGECTAFFHRHCLYEHFEVASDKTKGADMKTLLAESRRRAKKDKYPSKES